MRKHLAVLSVLILVLALPMFATGTVPSTGGGTTAATLTFVRSNFTDVQNQLDALSARIGLVEQKNTAQDADIADLKARVAALENPTPPPPPPPPSGVTIQPGQSWNTAYQAASCGDVLSLAAGNHGTQTLTERASPCTDSTRITFKPVSGASVSAQEVIMGQGEFDGADFVTLKDFKLVGGFTTHGDANYITLDGIDGGVFSLWGGSNYKIVNGDWGPCASISSPSFQAGKCSAQNTFNNASSEITSSVGVTGGACAGNCQIDNVLIENNVIHDHVLYKVGDHYECVRMDASGGGHTTNMIVRKNRIFNCQIEAFTGTGLGGTTIFENNTVGSTQPTYGCDPFTSNCQGADRSQSFGCASDNIGTIIYRYNSAASGAPIPDSPQGTCAGAANIQSYGNVMDTDSGFTCLGGVNYSYNVHMNGVNTCGGSGEVAMSGMPYVNNSSGAAGDYHLASSTSPPNDRVPTSLACIGLSDFDGQTRPFGPNCDAGADER